MKKIFFVLIIFSVLILIGCQDNSNTNPVSFGSVDKIQAPKRNEITRGKILLDRILVVPGLGNTYYQLNGSISFIEEYFKFNKEQSTINYDVMLRMDIDATLTDTDLPHHTHNSWNIVKDSEDKIYVSEEGIYILEKVYPVQGRTDNLQLVCKFLVTTDGVELSSVKLENHPL